MSRPLVTVIVPCRNEARYIVGCLDSLLRTEYPAGRLDIIVVDGMSDDGTRETVARYAERDARIRLLSNPKRIAPSAMNIGIAEARGTIIVRMDAHNEYPADYIPLLVDWLDRTGADNVGGAWVTVPADDSRTAQAIALALSHPFGIGNARFRLGVTAPTPVDTVPFGCFRRELFDRIGQFDEELARDQDDELNFRILRRGGSVVLVPDVVSRYHARGSLRQLARTYFQYGLFKPLVAYKVGRFMTARQLAPPALALLLLVGIVGAAWSSVMRSGLALVLAVYLVAALACGLWVGRRAGFGTGALLAVTFPTLHLSYGIGFLAGALRLAIKRWRPEAAAETLPLSR